MNSLRLHVLRLALFFALTLIIAPLGVRAQPSGGPYGPLLQNYEVPMDTAHVFYVAPDGKADAAGTALVQPTTLDSAITRVVTGDAIVLRGGTYRTGGLKLNQGITLQPYADEKPILKGTEVVTQRVAQGNNLWRVAWSHLFPAKPADWWRRDHEGRKTPLWLFNNDMVFVDGAALKAVGWEGAVDANSYFIDYEAGQIYLGTDPANHVVEITTQDSAIVRTTAAVHGRNSDGKGLVIRGLTFTQYAYRALEIEGHEPEGPEVEAQFGKDVVGTVLENVTITHCSRVAGYFRGDRFTMRHCLVSDTSTEGVYLIASSDCLLEKNIFRRNNVEEITGYFPSAVKIFNQTHRVTCRDNLVIDQPHSNGIWYDVGNVDGVFINNWIQGCVDGFFFEISNGVVCAGNVFVDCDKGVRILNSAHARIYHNTFVNTVASIERTERSAVGDHFGWHPATGPGVDQREGHIFVGNLLAADATFPKALLRFDQTPALRGKLTTPQVAQLDANLYIRAGETTTRSLIVWAPATGANYQIALKTPAELNQLYPQFEAHSQLVATDLAEVLRSPELRNYELIHRLSVSAPLPDDIRKLLGWPPQKADAPGAFAVGR